MDNSLALKLVRLGIFAALGLYLLLFAAAVRMGAVLQPFSDMYDLVARWIQFRDQGGLLAYLIDPHNLHRLAYTRALVGLDMGVLHGSEVAYPVVGVLCLLAAAAILARAAWVGAPETLRLPAAVVAIMLVLSSVNALDAVFPINTPYVHAFALSVAALVVWDNSRWRWLALPLAALAALGNAVALVLWPAFLVAAWGTGERWRTLAKLAAFGVAFIALYATGQRVPAHGAFDLPGSIHYGLVWLGLPWSTRIGGPIIGGVLLILSLLAVATRGGPGSGRLERLAVRLILFSLGAAAMAVLGRSALDPEVPVRYALFLTPLHLGVFFLALPWIARRKPALVFGVLFAVLLAQQAYGVLKVKGAADQVRAALADFAAGRDTPMVKVFVHPEPKHAQAVLEQMRAQTGRNTTFAQ